MMVNISKIRGGAQPGIFQGIGEVFWNKGKGKKGPTKDKKSFFF